MCYEEVNESMSSALEYNSVQFCAKQLQNLCEKCAEGFAHVLTGTVNGMKEISLSRKGYECYQNSLNIPLLQAQNLQGGHYFTNV